jgi:hypothetical protein
MIHRTGQALTLVDNHRPRFGTDRGFGIIEPSGVPLHRKELIAAGTSGLRAGEVAQFWVEQVIIDEVGSGRWSRSQHPEKHAGHPKLPPLVISNHE